MFEKPIGIPQLSGCYLFHNADGDIIYVGKAKVLSSRLSSYFQRRGSLAARTQALMDEAASVEWIVTPSEVDALILENELIKQNQPRHNRRLKDDRGYPYVALDMRADFPAPRITREPHVRGVRYFGPYTDVKALRRSVDELTTAFPLRSCSRHKFNYHERVGRPCLLYDIGRCPGPCIKAIDRMEYHQVLDSWIKFFEGDVSALRGHLESQMDAASAEHRYEDAARARDGLAALERATATQVMVLDDYTDLDAIALAIDGGRACVVLFRVRFGRVIGRDTLLFDGVSGEAAADIIEGILPNLYGDTAAVPSVVLMNEQPTDLARQYLNQMRARVVQVVVPRRGRRLRVLKAALEDASAVLARDSLRRQSDHNVRSQALTDLGLALGLERPPYRIECFDMSHIQGTNYVGSMVVFEDGLAKKQDYRQFHVRDVDGNNDVGAMKEVVGRRLRHWSEAPDTTKFPRPDLIIVDGGAAQLHAALEAAEEAGVEGQVEFTALAKREELLYRPGVEEPVFLSRGSESLYLVQRIRDEAHRFAITFHRSKRGRAMTKGALDGIAGLGNARRERVLESFGSLDAVRQASPEDIAGLSWLPEKVRLDLYNALHGDNVDG